MNEDDLYPKEFSEADLYIFAGFLSIEWGQGERDVADVVADVRKGVELLRPVMA